MRRTDRKARGDAAASRVPYVSLSTAIRIILAVIVQSILHHSRCHIKRDCFVSTVLLRLALIAAKWVDLIR